MAQNNQTQRPTVYLGLGGTGNLAISYAKKLYEEEYGVGNIPNSIAFVTVDFQTDMDKSSLLATDITNDFIKITTTTNPKEHYKVRRDEEGEYKWMFENNQANLDNKISKGAKAVRTTGRLYTEMVLPTVMNQLRSIISRVKSLGSNAATSDEIMIYMVMSLAGGTGAGSFITLANQIKIEYGNKVTLYGYGVTHNVFKAMDVSGTKMPNVELNSISSILDLDYIYTINSKMKPLELSVGSKQTQLTDYLFDGFFVIDNTSENGNVIRDITDLCEVIGTCLYAYGGEAGSAIEATINNVGPKSGNYNVGNKIGWVQSIGACQVVYKGDLLSETYSLKAAKELIRKLRAEGPEMQAQAQNWTEIVNIREDGDQHNLLTDRIYSPENIQKLKIPLLDVQQSDDINKDYLKEYLSTLSSNFPSPNDIDKLSIELNEKLEDKINEFLKSKNAIGNSIEFLKSLKTFCEQYKKEMNDEAKALNKDKVKREDNFLQRSFDEYNENKHKSIFFKNKDKNQEILDETVGIPAKEISKLSHEIRRREVAAGIFVSLVAKIDSILMSLQAIDKKLDNLSKQYRDKVAQLQRSNSDSLDFEYDLSYNERINMSVDSKTVLVENFIESLGNNSLLDIKVDDLNDSILKFTSRLPQADEYRNKILTQVIDELPLTEYEDLKREIKAKSSRWLTIDSRGRQVNNGTSVGDAIVKNLVVCVYEPSEGYKSRLEKDENFLNDVYGKQFLPVNKDIAKQRMIFCRVDGSIIPYCIDFLNDTTMTAYNKRIEEIERGEMVFNPHFDKLIFDKMREEGFSLKPQKKQ